MANWKNISSRGNVEDRRDRTKWERILLTEVSALNQQSPDPRTPTEELQRMMRLARKRRKLYLGQ